VKFEVLVKGNGWRKHPRQEGAWGEDRLSLYWVLRLALDEEEWSTSRSGRIVPGTNWLGGWAGSMSQCGRCVEAKTLFLPPELTSRTFRAISWSLYRLSYPGYFEVFAAVNIYIAVFCVTTPCSLVVLTNILKERSRSVIRAELLLRGRRRQHVYPKLWCHPVDYTDNHGARTYKTSFCRYVWLSYKLYKDES